MRFASLGSGSRGNGTLIDAGDTRLLIDCGFSLKELRRRAGALAFDLESLDAILVTHEHSDHCSGVAALSRACNTPVYMTHGTWASGRIGECAELHLFDADAILRIGGLEINAVAVPHDAREPVQFVFAAERRRIGVLTDLGSITPHVRDAFAGCQLLLLEFNHDRQMLLDGPYPPALKRRVGGDWGHLSNSQAVDFLSALDTDGLQHVVIAHTSEKNNSRQCISDLLAHKLPHLRSRIVWADQQTGFPWLAVESATPVAESGDEDQPLLVSDAKIGAY